MINMSSRWDEVVFFAFCSINILSLKGLVFLKIELSAVVDEGGLGKMWKLFGEKTDSIIEELNKELAA